MICEVGEFRSSLQTHRWADYVPVSTPVSRRSVFSWRGQLDWAERYMVSDGTPVIRIDAYDGEPWPDVPAGHVAVDEAFNSQGAIP